RRALSLPLHEGRTPGPPSAALVGMADPAVIRRSLIHLGLSAARDRSAPEAPPERPRRGPIGSPDVADGVALGERVVCVDHVAREAGDPGLAAQGRYHCGVRAHGRLRDQAAGEDGAEDALVAEVLVEAEASPRVESGHARAGAGAAR